MSTLKEMIPVSRVCPLCMNVKLGVSQWVLTNMGDAVCRSCSRQFPELSNTTYTPKIPENCPICDRHTVRGEMKKIRMWVKTKTAYMCSECAKLPPLVGSYRVDLRGREHRVVAQGLGAFAFGLSRITTRSHASTLARYQEQQLRMWAIVSQRMELCDVVASWFVTKTSQTWDDLQSVALEGLCRAAVEMMWNIDYTRGAFDSYAKRAMINACKNHLKVENRKASKQEPFGDEHELSWSLDEYEEHEDDAWISGPQAAQIVEQLLTKMSEVDAYVLTRRFVDDASFEEIGCELGVLRSAVHNRWARIKTQIINLLEAWAPGTTQ